MVTFIYYIIFLLSVIFTLTVILNHKKVNSLNLTFAFLVICNSFGRFLLSTSRTVDTAIVGQRLLYLGAIFGYLIMIFFLDQLCPIRHSNIMKIFMSIFSVIVFSLAMTMNFNKWYYKRATLVRENGCTTLVKEYGPAHNVYHVFLISCTLIIIFYIIHAIIKRKKTSTRTVCIICTMGGASTVCYILDRMLDSPIDLVSIAYLGIIFCMVWMNNRLSVYDVTANMADTIMETGEFGCIEFDKKYRFMGNNIYSSELFPEIEKTWRIDAQVPVSDTFLYNEVVFWIKNRENDEKKTIFLNGCYYELFVRNITRGGGHVVGYMLEIANRTAENLYVNKIQNYNKDLKYEVSQKTKRISHIKDMLILGIASMVESRDNSTGGHIKRTSVGMEVFCTHLLKYKDQLERDEKFFKTIIKVAPMHDLGKIAVDDKILRKNGKFTDEEYGEMKKHSLEGARIVNNILRGVEEDEFVDIAINVAHYHHEKWNGQGYPEGLRGTDIPLEARIMALVDVFDALVSKRCYKDAFSYDTAFKIIEESKGSHFDPFLSDRFLECRSEFEDLYNHMNINS